MKKFVFVYYGGGGSDQPSQDEMEKIKADWGAWFEELGSALVDGGNPFNDNGMSVSEKTKVEAIEKDQWPATGYTIVNAESMDQAVEMAKGCPMHTHTDGKASVRVYEAVPM